MNLERQAAVDALANRGMLNNPKWSVAERQKYQAAYLRAKNKAGDGRVLNIR